MLEEQIIEAPRQEEDPTKCYVCGVAATATCTRCKTPVCEEHSQVVHEYVTKVPMILCDECADYYEGLVTPD